MAAAKLDTLTPTGAPEPKLDPQSAAAVAVAERIIRAGGGRAGPFVSGFAGGLLALAVHHYYGNDALIERMERFEQAQSSHNAYVIAALVALSKNEPLPPAPPPTIGPR
jgi:alkylation response protein AidB-like acyl-CoA dehydrogenase